MLTAMLCIGVFTGSAWLAGGRADAAPAAGESGATDTAPAAVPKVIMMLFPDRDTPPPRRGPRRLTFGVASLDSIAAGTSNASAKTKFGTPLYSPPAASWPAPLPPAPPTARPNGFGRALADRAWA
jgi:hypothetical protein